MPRPFRKRLTADIPTPIYDQVKIMAKRRNITLTRFLMQLIYDAIQRERELEK